MNGSTPNADFHILRFDTLCANNIIQLKDLSTVVPGNITQAEIIWDFNGAPSTIEVDNNPYYGKIYNHIYPDFHSPASMPYQVKFIAHTGASTVCIDDFDKPITIHASPDLSFKPFMDTCLYINPFPITLATELSGLPGSFNYYGIGLSAGNYLNTLIPGPGIDTITCMYTSTAGCIDTAYQQINIYAPPIANFGFTQPVCKGTAITFTDSSTIPLGNVVKWIWDFDDGSALFTTTSNSPFTHIYTIAKKYNVKLTVLSNAGCTSLEKSKNVLISPIPVANFIHSDTACLPNATVFFTSNSFIADSTQNLFTFLWNFNDTISGTANTSTLGSPSHTYHQLGAYQVYMKVTSNAGCYDDTTITVDKIYPQPKAYFSIDKRHICLGEAIQLTDSSKALNGNINSWHWNFDDTNISSSQNPTHTYTDSGNYNISLFIINDYGCYSDTAIHPLLVYPLPKINAGPDLRIIEEIGAPLQATALGTSLVYNWTSSTYLSSTSILNPYCMPKEDITYILTVTGEGGCVSTDEVNVVSLKMLKIPNTFSPNNDGINDTWQIGNLYIYPYAKIQVFTRTGQLIYQTNGYYKPWDGTKAGKPLPSDTYYYIIEPGESRKPITGYITIMK